MSGRGCSGFRWRAWRRNNQFVNKKSIPADLRPKLEDARLDALALFRSLDTLGVSPESLPHQFHSLAELDADFAEALWALDQPAKALNFNRMLKDTLAALQLWPRRFNDFVAALDATAAHSLLKRIPVVRHSLEPSEAYSGVPGRNPRNG